MAKVSYHPGSDAVYIALVDRPSVRTLEQTYNVMVDYGADGQIVGYDIQSARMNKDIIGKLISEMVIAGLPIDYSVEDEDSQEVVLNH